MSGRPHLTAAEIERQVALLADPPPPAALVRPCTVGDGLRVLDETERARLERRWSEAAAAGRFSKFVPASGAASRMFSVLEGVAETGSVADLERARERGDARARDLLELLERSGDLPFHDRLPPSSDLAALAAILAADGLDYGRRAKGLIPFHRYPGGARTPMIEHLVEGASYVLDSAGRGRIHFTVGASQLDAFRAEAAASPLAEAWEIGLSTQRPETDTVALEADGSPVRDADGGLLFRPGGHGALLGNLEACGGDLVFVKNIDNILPESRQPLVAEWQRALGGLLVTLERRAVELAAALAGESRAPTIDAAADFCSAELGRTISSPPTDPGALADELIDLLDRPLRVCGMVPSTGEPGGGPFWVRGDSGAVYPQIVESAQVDLENEEQQRVWTSSTHFNPVMLAVSLRRHDGTPHRLADFVDRRAVFVNEKPYDGRQIRVLERPGLWNGAMASWNTVFVEVPLQTFAPVKTVLDLLRPEHQGT